MHDRLQRPLHLRFLVNIIARKLDRTRGIHGPIIGIGNRKLVLDLLEQSPLGLVSGKTITQHRVYQAFKRASLNQPLHHAGNVHDLDLAANLAIEIVGGLLVQALSRGRIPFLDRRQIHPPNRSSMAEVKLRALHPIPEGVLSNQITTFSRTHALRTRRPHIRHIEAGLHEILCTPAVATLRTVRPPQLLFVRHIEEPPVVVLVHRSGSQLAAPHAVTTQRIQNVRHEAPANFQTLEHSAMPNVAPQHQTELPVEKLRMPWHTDPRLQVLDLLHPVALAVVIHDHCAIPKHLADSPTEHQVVVPVHREARFVCLRRREMMEIRPIQIRTRTLPGIHFVARLIVTRPQASALHEGRRVLRKGDDVLLELLEARTPHRDIRHLHMVESQEHGLDDSSGVEEMLQLVRRKREDGIHLVLEPELRDDVLLARMLADGLPQQTHVLSATEAMAVVRLRQQQLGRGLLQRRHALPRAHLQIARRTSILQVPLKEVHAQLRRRHERRVEGGKAPRARVAMEAHHASQNGLLRMHRRQDLEIELHVVSRGPGLASFQR